MIFINNNQVFVINILMTTHPNRLELIIKKFVQKIVPNNVSVKIYMWKI